MYIKLRKVFVHTSLNHPVYVLNFIEHSTKACYFFLIYIARVPYNIAIYIYILYIQGHTHPQKKGADTIPTSFQTWGGKAPHTPPHIFFSVNCLDYY